ncbi:amine sulfotransferase-like [Acanthaster planci]|uniref:Amine sulfotransferase-like n=1 Tax=Acanthaster planci TaxID=133434 RepID=A0A8B7ZZD5_ACAPL|nr:amine sulfotransferase-like [Acanthaster planci]XP_022110091.1 amine sulfotransferase-like [Acanthaster planci]
MAADGAKQMPPGMGPAGGVFSGGMTPEKMKEMMAATHEYKGVIYPKLMVPRENLEAMETFKVRDDDIFILTYPKCGTHWTMEIVYLILTEGYPDKIDRHEKMKFGGLEMFVPTPTNQVPAYKYVQTITSRRVLPTHLPANVIPPAVLQGKGKVVYVTRNPKDCLTSMFGFMSKQAGMANWNEMFEMFLSKKMLNGSFFDFSLDYWKHRHDSNFLFLKYEDMKRDPKSAVIAIANHIGCALSEEAVDRVVQNSSMEHMKKSYKKADDQGVMAAFAGKGEENLGKFLRKGVVGDWKNYLTVAQNERFDALYREKMAGSGLTFEFE